VRTRLLLASACLACACSVKQSSRTEPSGALATTTVMPKRSLHQLALWAARGLWCLDGRVTDIRERSTGEESGWIRRAYIIEDAVDLCASGAPSPPARIALIGGYDVKQQQDIPYCLSSRDCTQLHSRILALVDPAQVGSYGPALAYWDNDQSLPLYSDMLGWFADEDRSGMVRLETLNGRGIQLIERARVPFATLARALTLLTRSTEQDVVDGCSRLNCPQNEVCQWAVGCGNLDRLGEPDPCPECALDPSRIDGGQKDAGGPTR